MWDLIVSIPDHCLSFYSEILNNKNIIVILGDLLERLASLFI